jgi:DNA sulfur modification protein DndD
MILDELVLTDFGVYRGRQAFNLTPVSADRPIILIGAQNGGGKTTFLDGLQLAFFGRLGHGAMRSGSYEDYLKRSINRGADRTQGAAVSVRFRRTVEGREQKFEIRRSWSDLGRGAPKEHFEVLVDGEPDRVLATHWNEHVEGMLPPRIAPLFFFDGEQIEQFAQLERSGEIVSTAVSGLLGLDIVERLQLDLEVFERRKIAGDGEREVEAALRAAAEAADAAAAAYDVARSDQASRKRELDWRKGKLDAARQALKAEGGDLYASRNDLRALEQQTDAAAENVDRALRTWAADIGPLMLVPDLLRDIGDQAAREADGEAARAVLAVLKARDKALLNALKAAGAGGPALQAAQTFMANDEVRLARLANADRYLELPAAARAALQGLQAEGFSAAEEMRRVLLQDVDKLQIERDEIARQLAAMPAMETIAPFLATIDAEEKAVAQAELQWTAATQALEAADRARTATRQRYQSKLDEQVDQHLVQEDAQRMVEHSQRVRTTLQRFHREVVRHHVRRIETLILEGLGRLLRKDDLITGVRIDPDTFAISLKGGGWDDLPAERLSAGERQLFAVALLWALARASGQTAPTVIDTPLGRLDSEHRQRLVEAYFPRAAHQVILLSTDEEIDARQLERLAPHLSRSLTIEYDAATRGSRVRDGYGVIPQAEREPVQ